MPPLTAGRTCEPPTRLARAMKDSGAPRAALLQNPRCPIRLVPPPLPSAPDPTARASGCSRMPQLRARNRPLPHDSWRICSPQSPPPRGRPRDLRFEPKSTCTRRRGNYINFLRGVRPVNACRRRLINCRMFIHFLVRLAFRPSGGAPNGPQLAATIASSSTTLAPTPRHQRLATVGGWCEPIIQPFLSRFSSKRFCFQALLWHKNA
jgi:hypothetical protein